MTYVTHITYKTAKLLKEFLGESAPEPMCHEYFTPQGDVFYRTQMPRREKEFPMYRLHDLLSKTFCEAMAAEMRSKYYDSKKKPYILDVTSLALEIRDILCRNNYSDGLPAVEKALIGMMRAK